MEASLLVESIAGLVIVLGILIFLLLKPTSEKKSNKINIKSSSEAKEKTDLDTLRHIIRNRMSSTEKLENAVEMVLKYHGKIPAKLGIRINPQFDAYMEIMVTLCHHPHTTKDIILKLDKELTRLNPEYKSEINDALTKGLNSRK